MPKLTIGGLKLSPELIQIHLFPQTGRTVEAMFRHLADKQINLTGVTLEILEGPPKARCCILAEDRLTAEEALQTFVDAFAMRSGVGTLTIFPHQGRLDLVGRLLSVLGKEKLPIYGIASSFSSLIITTEYPRLDDAARAVCRVVTLPENHAPFRPEFRVKQI